MLQMDWNTYGGHILIDHFNVTMTCTSDLGMHLEHFSPRIPWVEFDELIASQYNLLFTTCKNPCVATISRAVHTVMVLMPISSWL